MGSNPTPRTKNAPPSISPDLIEYGFHLKKEGYRESSIDRSVRILKRLARESNLKDPDSVKAILAKLSWSLGTKKIAANVFANFYQFNGIPFTKPRYRRIEKVPFLPTEEEIER